MSGQRFVGQAMPRKEDARLLTGRGQFIADLQLPGMAHVAFARSSVAHGRILSIDISAAAALPGVVGVFVAKDIASDLAPVPGMQNPPPASWKAEVEHQIDIPFQPLVADEKVRFVGEAYAIVVAENRYIAEDAVDLIQADIEPLPVVVDVEAALQPEAERIHASAPGNVVARFCVRKGNVDAASLSGLRRLRRRFENHRFLALPMECRGVVAQYHAERDALTLWSATQVVHWVRREVAKQLKLPEDRVRCVAPDVGGSFGVKGHVYPEEILVAWLARRLQRPVAWIEDRQENLLNSTHSRDDIHDAEVVFDDEGRIHALKDHFIKDSGAYTPVGIGAPSNTTSHICSQYRIPNLELQATVVATNKTPNAPYRGSGRPEATFVIERLMDLVAGALNLDPVEVRLRNMIRPEEMPYPVGIPYRDGVPITYDSGDFPGAFRKALEAIGGVEAFRLEQKKAWSEGRYLGLGLGCYVEGTGAGPFEGATVSIDAAGAITVATGACSQGQSHETVFAQVAADEWGAQPQDIRMVLADTDGIARGYGTIASRSAVNSSGAIRLASTTLRLKVLETASQLLECAPQDLEIEGGAVRLKGVPDRKVSLGEVVKATGRAILEATEYFEPPTVTWSYGTHLAIVEVERRTGEVQIRKYVVAHDAGVLINPMVANGQIIGGICQGIGGCLLEQVVYDDQGQNLTASLLDYIVPVAAQMPEVELIHTEIPSPLNSLGVKGLGEGGAVGPPAAIINGVCDALQPLGFEWNRSFLNQADVIAALQRRFAVR